jgi:hypothetical protein
MLLRGCWGRNRVTLRAIVDGFGEMEELGTGVLGL